MTVTKTSLTPEARNAIARIYKGNTVIGAGFMVQGRYVLTCAHVVRDALGWKSETHPIGETVKLNFPYLGLGKKLSAEVSLYRLVRNEDEKSIDVAGLRLIDPLPGEISPVTFLASYQPHSAYRVLGFPKGHAEGIASYGQLLEDLPNGWVQMEDTKEQGIAILPGFSGAPAWDEATSTVVGMVVARERNQPEAKIGFMVPARALIAVQRELQSGELLNLLAPYEETNAEAITMAYQLCCPLQEAMPESLEAKLLKLQDALRGESRFEVIDRFAGLLSRPELNPVAELSEALEGLVRGRVAEQFEALQAEVKALLAQERANQETDFASHLMIYVKDETGDARSVLALFVRDARKYDIRSGKGSMRVQATGEEPFHEKVTQEALPSLVQACVNEVVGKSQNLMLHLILPLAWLNEACDRYSLVDRVKFPFLPDVRVGVRCCCVVRLTERLEPEILKTFKEPWQNKWQTLQALNPAQLCEAFVSGDGLSPSTELYAQLNENRKVGLRLVNVSDEAHYSQVFGILIATGTPAALWLRHDQFADGVDPETTLGQLLNCKIATLPEKIKQVRSEAIGYQDENAHIGHHLSFLWDDPTLIPPSTQKLLGMPQS